jgi:FAD/FMN-containing dehydrogenase
MSSHDALAMAGEVLAPGQDGYDEAAATVFAIGTPDLVVRPRDPAGVAAALRYAAHRGLPVSVRSGGHSPAGHGTNDGGMVIDLRHLRAVRVIDRDTRLVRVGAGATWGEVAAALRPDGLALTSGDTASVGVGGLTLAGGIGWMVRRYGLAIDAVTAADVVTADGRLVRADATEHPDLLWALRGGGGNFGVVVSLDFTAQPVDAVHYGAIVYRLDTPLGTAACGAAGGLPGLIRAWRDLMRASDERLTTALALVPPMMGRPSMVMLRCCYASADAAAATAALAPFRGLAPVAADEVRLVPYAGVLDETRMPPGMRVQMRNAFFRQLDNERAAAIAGLFRDGAAVELRSLGGAFGRVPADATAFAHRDASVFLVAGTMLPPGAPDEAADKALATWPAVAAQASGAYTGFSGQATDAEVAAAYPTATYQRLAAVKRRYDPDNVFHRNHNIRPEGVDLLSTAPSAGA